ncbi:molybdenum ABC transporter ATP-binding protein [Allohahella marinimesophila]|uniref:Molybdenum ABC transporter ATP-binding protein n=1 Tax=Allohahella marinimesophila TaxID=1054972 RepID=A0ABP7P0X6_9GAMM
MAEDSIKFSFSLALPGTSFSLDVEAALPGRGISAIFGASGSGKTTLLRCIAGLQRVSNGRVSVNDQVWQNGERYWPTHRRPLGYVFQEASLFTHLSVEGNLAYAIKRADSGVSGIDLAEAVSLLGLSPLLKQRPAQLSGGERQRVAIARALLIRPRLLLMDEPLASLDEARKQEILPYLERLRHELAVPMLYVSHSRDEVARLADHLLMLDAGRVVANGPLVESFSRIDLPLTPGDQRGVVLEGRVAERDSEWHLTRVIFDGGMLWIRDSGDELGAMVRLHVHAGDVSIALTPQRDSSILNSLQARVSAITPDSSQAALCLVKLELGASHLLARITRRSAQQLGLEKSQLVWAQIKSVAIVR